MFKLVKNTDLTSLLFVMLKLVMKTAGRPPKKSSKRGASMVSWLMAFEMEIRIPKFFVSELKFIESAYIENCDLFIA